MNLSRIIEITGQRLRIGKVYSERLSNAQIKEVLEMAVQVIEEALINEGRIEIQGFAVIEVIQITTKNPRNLFPKANSDKNTSLQNSQTRIARTRWLFKPSQKLRAALKGGKSKS
jgi:nucleoid DNA-binding protein